MITFLSGGTGTLKLILAMRNLKHDADIAVIANTSDTAWIGGNHAARELDNIMYLFAGVLNRTDWNGILGDTYSTYRYLHKLGRDELLPTGDKQRAVQIARGDMLTDGLTLTDATEILCGSYGISATILPMTDTWVSTYVKNNVINEGERIHLLNYRQNHRDDSSVHEIEIECEIKPEATKKVTDAISSSETVIIGPGCPLSSTAPIISCGGILKALEDTHVVSVSPVPQFKPTIKKEEQLKLSENILELYSQFTDLFVLDIHDETEVNGALRLDTTMRNKNSCESLAWDIMSVIRRKQLSTEKHG
ncbi:MAG: YvcK family protein [Methanogenium sp.]|nr:YvcK family protein [Methanogenium sp.]